MLRLFTFALLLLFATSVRADIAWETDYNTATARSRATGKPLFIDFYTDWCGVCKRMDTEGFPDPRVQNLARHFVMLRLNADGSGAPAARAFGVRSYPTLVFASSRGQMLSQSSGYGLDALLSRMQMALRSNGPAFKTPRSVLKTPRSKPTATRPAKVRSIAQWRAMPELRHVTQNGNYGGTLLLGAGGAVSLDVPAKKAKLAAKTRKTRR